MAEEEETHSVTTKKRPFEEELSSDLEKDDVVVLEKRYRSYRKDMRAIQNKILTQKSSSSIKHHPPRIVRSQTQWTRALDAVQEHFSSHVTLDGISQRLPPTVHALKLNAKHTWLLYKKRECERRKRIRRKIEEEKEKEILKNEPANILLSMVDMCEICKRLYVTVNLFWGVTICDGCYFNPQVINEIMKTRYEAAESKIEITPENIVEEITKKGGGGAHKKTTTTIPPPPPLYIPPPPLPPHPAKEDNNNEEEDIRPISTYNSSSSSNLPPLPPPLSPCLSPGNPIEKFEVQEGGDIICYNMSLNGGNSVSRLSDMIEDEEYRDYLIAWAEANVDSTILFQSFPHSPQNN